MKYDEFEQYIRATEPGSKERAELWQTAIGLQQVDGLEVSDYLVETAKKHIEGEVSIDDVDSLIATYYQSEAAREMFLRNLLLGENNDLKNRYLHIRASEILGTHAISSQESSQEITVSSQEKPELMLKMLEINPNMNLQEIADKLNMTRRGVQKIADKLKSEGKLVREGSTKSGKWIVRLTPG